MTTQTKGTGNQGGPTAQGPQVTTDEIVRHVNEMFVEKVESSKLEIGVYLLEHVFEGDMEKALSRNPQKNDSFEKIAKHSDLHPHVNAGTLSRWVQAAALLEECEQYNADHGTLTVSHLAAIARLRDRDQRLGLVVEAATQSMNVGDIHERVREIKRVTSRKAQEEINADNLDLAKLKSVMANPVEAMSNESVKTLLQDTELLAEKLTRNERLKLYESVEAAKAQMEAKKDQIEKREAKLTAQKEPAVKTAEALGEILEQLGGIVLQKTA